MRKAHHLAALGRFEEAFAADSIARDLEIGAQPFQLTNYGWHLYLAGRFEEAIEVYDYVLSLEPDLFHAQAVRNPAQLEVFVERGQPDSVFALLDGWADDPAFEVSPAYVLAVAGRTDSVEPADSVEELLQRPFFADPLRRHDIAPITDGASAIVLAAGDRARELRERPAWITGFEHRIETPILGARDLTTSPSTAVSAQAATGGDAGSIEVAELHAPFTHQQLILTEAIGLGSSTKVNPSGGALAANPMFSAGLERIGFAAQHIWNGSAGRTLAHATSGPALQQNLVAVMEGRDK